MLADGGRGGGGVPSVEQLVGGVHLEASPGQLAAVLLVDDGDDNGDGDDGEDAVCAEDSGALQKAGPGQLVAVLVVVGPLVLLVVEVRRLVLG